MQKNLFKMIRCFFLGWLLIVATTIVTAQETAVSILLLVQDADKTPLVADTDYPQLHLLVAPVNQGRVPYQGLAPSQFTIHEAGEQHEDLIIESVVDPQQPVSVMIVLDTSNAMQPVFNEVRTAVINSYDALELTDQSGVLAFETAVNLDEPFPQLDPQHEINFTNDEGALINLLNTLAPADNSATPIYDALLKAVRLTEIAAPTERRAVILITNGTDRTADGTGNGSKRAGADTIAQIAREQHIPLFPIGLGAEVDAALLQEMANQTGGKFFAARDGNTITQAINDVVQQLRQNYRVVYEATTAADNTLHDLQLVVQTPQGVAEASLSFKAYYPIVPVLRGINIVTEDGTAYAAENVPPLLGTVTITPDIVAREGLTAVTYHLNNIPIHQATLPPWEFVWQTDDLDTSVPHRLAIEATTANQQTAQFEANFVLQPCDTFCRLEQQLGFQPAYLFLGLGLVILGVFIWLLRQQHRQSAGPTSTGSDLFPREVHRPPVAAKRPLAFSQPTQVDSLLTEYDSQENLAGWSNGGEGGPGLSHHTSYTQVDKTEVKKPERPLFPKTEVLSRSLKHAAKLTDHESGAVFDLALTTTIGRAPDNDIVIKETAVSGHHAKITLQGDKFILEDFKVTNPTQVNGEDITQQPHTLADGDELTIGRRVLTFTQLP